MTASYMLRTEKDELVHSLLLMFSDEHDLLHEKLALENLTAYLKHLILLNHYSGLGPLVKAFWRWNDDDTREELELVFIREQREMENMDHYYKIVVKNTLEEVTGFEVRLP